jgi:hypothetical protein
MHFKIKTPEAEVNLSAQDLFVQILNQAFADYEDDKNTNTDTFVEQINKILDKHNVILDSTNRQIYSIYFLAGYYYKIFINKNNVTVEEK